MSDLFAEMEAVKVKVKKCGNEQSHSGSVYKKFGIDPRITSFDILKRLVAKAFDIKSEFTLSYLGRDESNKPIYSALLSDWDLDAALLSYSHPCLRLKVDVETPPEGFEDWEVICPVDLPHAEEPPVTLMTSPRGSIFRYRFSAISRKMDVLHKVFGLMDNASDDDRPSMPPLSDTAYRNFLDSEGRLIRPLELRRTVFLGGVDPSVRKYVWRLLLNVFPDGLNGQQRLDYMKGKSAEYYQIRDSWKKKVQSGEISHHLQYVTNLVRKDVLRTDRSHKLFAGSDENKNVAALYSILTTYAMAHPSVSYCQGMSDLASPLLVVMKDEAHAYIGFCGLMKRMKRNFRGNGRSITTKFDHLRRLLQHYDLEFYEYLSEHQSDDLLFCYRWLLVELKREFAFDDALRMLEVIWSSLPPDPPETELELVEPFQCSAHNSSPNLSELIDFHAVYQHTCPSKSSSGNSSGQPSKRPSGNCDDNSSSDDSSEYMLMDNSLTRDLNKELRYLEESAGRIATPEIARTRESSGNSGFLPMSNSTSFTMEETLTDSRANSLRESVNGNAIPRSVSGIFLSPAAGKRPWPSNIMDSGVTDLSHLESSVLPAPHELGDGNPFLVFVCLTILLQHRDHILSNNVQHHFELAMHFDKMIKRHDLKKILSQARRLFAEYLKSQQTQHNVVDDDSDDASVEAHNF